VRVVSPKRWNASKKTFQKGWKIRENLIWQQQQSIVAAKCVICEALASLKKNQAKLRAKCVQTAYLVGHLFGSRREEIKHTDLHLALDS
jgi:hypothetical protein